MRSRNRSVHNKPPADEGAATRYPVGPEVGAIKASGLSQAHDTSGEPEGLVWVEKSTQARFKQVEAGMVTAALDDQVQATGEGARARQVVNALTPGAVLHDRNVVASFRDAARRTFEAANDEIAKRVEVRMSTPPPFGLLSKILMYLGAGAAEYVAWFTLLDEVADFGLFGRGLLSVGLTLFSLVVPNRCVCAVAQAQPAKDPVGVALGAAAAGALLVVLAATLSTRAAIGVVQEQFIPVSVGATGLLVSALIGWFDGRDAATSVKLLEDVREGALRLYRALGEALAASPIVQAHGQAAEAEALVETTARRIEAGETYLAGAYEEVVARAPEARAIGRMATEATRMTRRFARLLESVKSTNRAH